MVVARPADGSFWWLLPWWGLYLLVAPPGGTFSRWCLTLQVRPPLSTPGDGALS